MQGWFILFQSLIIVAFTAKPEPRRPSRTSVSSLSSLETFSGKKAGNTMLNDHKYHPLNELFESIFGKYRKELVPKRPTSVRLDLLLIKVKSTNEREGILESVVALLMEWQDERLAWEPPHHNNVTFMAFDSDNVWLPDIALVNSADHLYSISRDTRFVVRVSCEGTMKFVPTGTTRTWCELKLLTFPFDKQTCSYEFESWSLDSSTLTINYSSSAVVDASFSSPQWALCDHSSSIYSHYYDFSGEVFSRIRFDFVIRRKTTFYMINLIFPCATLSMIQLLVFLIPSTDSTSDRVSFGTTNLLTLVVFQTIVTEEMPRSSDSITALSKYIISLILVSAVGILEAIVAERLLRPRCTPPPQWLMRIFKFPLLWKVQLPSGIGRMLLQLWSAGKHISAQNLQEKTSRRPSRFYGNKPFLPLKQKTRGRSLPLTTTDSERRICCIKKRNNRMAVRKKNSFRKSSDLHRYVGQLRPSPHPLFLGATLQPNPFHSSLMARFRLDSDSSPKQHRFRLSSVNENSVMPPSVVSYEAEIIEIGKMWGVLVTRLDGFTFVMCTLCVFLLPLLLFLPAALDDEVCY